LVLLGAGLLFGPLDLPGLSSGAGEKGVAQVNTPVAIDQSVERAGEALKPVPLEKEVVSPVEQEVVVDDAVVESDTSETIDTGEQEQKSLSLAAADVGQIAKKPEQTSQVETNLAEIPEQAKKTEQTPSKLDKVNRNQPVELVNSSDLSTDHLAWLEQKINKSKDWLRRADSQGVSIQVMMRSKSAAQELAVYLRTEWPLDLEKTYLYEVTMKDKQIYRVFYDEYPTISQGQVNMKQLPDAVKINSPYLHSIYRMQKALL
jgi:septal ring-binding cell division protein DamX